MKRYFKTIIAGVMALTVTFSGAACSRKPVEGGENIYIWAENSLTKVIQSLPYEKGRPDTLSITMAKNESEGGQVLMYARQDVSKYTVSVTDLTCGEYIIPKENISLYHEKYIALVDKQNNNPAFLSDAMVPDALLPMDVAVEYKENKIEKQKNQAIYLEVKTAENTAAGIYTGTVTVNADNNLFHVPLEVTVYDFAIPSEPSTMNYWVINNRAHWGTAELDSSDEMATKYFETLLEYRMQSSLPFSGIGGPEKYVELLRKYYSWPGFSGYNLHYERMGTFYEGEPSEFDAHLLKEYIKQIVYASMEDNVNYLDKAFVNFGDIIDEPSTHDSIVRVRDVALVYDMVINDTADELLAELNTYANYDFYVEEIEDTIRSLQCLLPEGVYSAKGDLEKMGVTAITHVPMANYLNDPTLRAEYASDPNGYWFYTCTVPEYPFFSNHIDDYLLGMRLTSWMQKAYDIDGYLNWAAALYISSTDGKQVDTYENSSRGFCPGDGFMFYPGAPYGIYGPVTSLRAVSYRDGMEDYEYLQIIDDIYAEHGYDASKILQSQYNAVFSGTIPTTSVETFESTKAQIVQMILSAKDELGLLYSDVEISFDGKATVRFSTVGTGVQVYKGETLLQPVSENDYVVVTDLAESSYLELTVRGGQREKKYSIYLSGMFEVIEEFESGATDGVMVSSTSLKEISADYAYSGEKSLKVNLKSVSDTTKTSYFAFDIKMFGYALPEISEIRFQLYNPGGEITLSLQAFAENKYNVIGNYTFAPGWNEVVIGNITGLVDIEKISRFFFITPELDEEQNVNGITFYIDSLVIFKV